MLDIDYRRRRLLKGAGASLVLPLLNGCGNSDQSSGAIDRDIPEQPPIQPGLSLQPRGIHLSFAGDPLRSRAVTWFTDGLANPGTFVEFGPVLPGMSPAAVQAEPMPRRSEGYVEEAFDIDVLTHRAFMEDVDPDHPLRYRVGHEGAWSEVFVVKAAPSGERFRFSHAADMGTTAAAGWVTQGLIGNDADFFLLPGDLSYADGFQPEWDVWFDRMQSLIARVPMMATPGNHERNDGNGDGYLSRTTHMEPRGARGWYSFTFKNVHFTCSSGASFAADGLIDVELGFLEADLASAAARRARGEIDFIVFTNHFPLWTDQQGRSPNSPRIIELFEDMLLRYGVDLVLVGHDHIYQRSHRKARGLRDEAGYIQVTAGNGGKSMRNFDPISDWSASAEQRYGYTEYAVEGSRIVANSYAVDVRLGIGDLATNLPAQRERLIDQFEVTPRPMIARRQFVLPARNVGQMLAEARIESLPLLQADTRMRNEMHLRRSLESLTAG
jgi:hypothetical protein